MPAFRRPAVLPALAVVLVAGGLAACGVKGELEPPPGAPAPRAETDAGTQKVFAGESRVQESPAQSVIPSMPPQEWSKERERRPVYDQRSAGPDRSRAADPHKPFVLDPLL